MKTAKKARNWIALGAKVVLAQAGFQAAFLSVVAADDFWEEAFSDLDLAPKAADRLRFSMGLILSTRLAPEQTMV